MHMLNWTPFSNLRFHQTDAAGHEFGVLLVKGTYRAGADGVLEIADEQAPILVADKYRGEDGRSSLWLPSDITPPKPRSDVIVNAVARSPGGGPMPSWECAVRVEGALRVEKRLRVFGPRAWQPRWTVTKAALARVPIERREGLFAGWSLGEAEAVCEVELSYELAAGGTWRNGDAVEADERNPLGMAAPRDDAEPDAHRPAPQIEAVEAPVADRTGASTPAGFGPVPPAWLPRRRLGGTFDAAWKAEVWPRWPSDYDPAFHNAAAEGLVYPGHLAGDEVVTLSGLDGASRPRTLRLPGHTVHAAFGPSENGLGEPVPLVLDTLAMDVSDEDPAEHRFFLSWRTTYPAAETEAMEFWVEEAVVRSVATAA